jgi:hypothetical protein
VPAERRRRGTGKCRRARRQGRCSIVHSAAYGRARYGSVNQAMSFGIPLVAAGLTEDKADVNARVAWSGVGINLATNEPTPQALRAAVRTVLDTPNYRSRASLMAAEFEAMDTRSEIVRIVDRIARSANGAARQAVMAAKQCGGRRTSRTAPVSGA